MSQLFVDHREAPLLEGATLFDCAEKIGIQVPTSCIKQGKCRECLLEVEEGEGLLSPRAPQESHLGDRFRLACRTTIVGEGTVRCHTMRRSAMRVVDEAMDLPEVAPALDPRVARGYGIALDLGTTTVAMRLFDLETGALVGSQSFENPQRFGGSDIMARIHYDTHHRGKLLQRTFLGYLQHAIERFPVPPESIFQLVVAANTTMRDLFFGLDVHSIGQKPYRSLTEHELCDGKRTTTALVTGAGRLRLPLDSDAQVYGLPLLGSHVGADAAACLLATGLAERSGVSVVMDIGTNTELIVGNRDRIVAASCPAGPAFEGGGVLCGMPGLDGAMERIAIADDGRVSFQVIGGEEPSGICGSGLVDLLSELLRTERMNAQGRFAEGIDRFVVDSANDIFFAEGDVNELAQAKGANVAGLRIVTDVFGISLDEIDRFYLAGGFARHIDLDAARRIGLIPPLPDEKLVRVGNASLEGASRVLLSETRRLQLEALALRVEHVELETHPDFFDFFVEGCQFVPIGAEVLR
ncbi:MAG: ASKHA domain-containing protein [Vicinamibacteria bacterium]